MMHGHEKSDPAIVAVKPTNKAERSAAELVEPRVGTEGNANQQSTHWTQNQARVSQALERIRQAFRRHTPEVGAVCGKAARTDLCGGREVTRVPTAKSAFAHIVLLHLLIALLAVCDGGQGPEFTVAIGGTAAVEGREARAL